MAGYRPAPLQVGGVFLPLKILAIVNGPCLQAFLSIIACCFNRGCSPVVDTMHREPGAQPDAVPLLSAPLAQGSLEKTWSEGAAGLVCQLASPAGEMFGPG